MNFRNRFRVWDRVPFVKQRRMYLRKKKETFVSFICEFDMLTYQPRYMFGVVVQIQFVRLVNY